MYYKRIMYNGYNILVPCTPDITEEELLERAKQMYKIFKMGWISERDLTREEFPTKENCDNCSNTEKMIMARPIITESQANRDNLLQILLYKEYKAYEKAVLLGEETDKGILSFDEWLEKILEEF